MGHDAAALTMIALVVACEASPSVTRLDAAPEAAPSASASTTMAEPPIVHPSFDAGGRTEIELPTVRCDDLGQVGWSKVFPPATWKVNVTKELLALDDPPSQLRAYVGPYSTVLGPPGLRCRGWYGSSGQWLEVAPPEGVEEDPYRRGPEGEVIMLNESYWYTSGRFRCARLASRVFPTLRGRAKEVYDGYHGLSAVDGFTTNPYPGEFVSVEDRFASYVDPPRVSGIAKEGAWVTPNEDPIHGAMVHWQGLDPRRASMLVLAVRLRAEREPLVAAVVADFEQRMRTCSQDDDCFGLAGLPRCFDGTEDDPARCP